MTIDRFGRSCRPSDTGSVQRFIRLGRKLGRRGAGLVEESHVMTFRWGAHP